MTVASRVFAFVALIVSPMAARAGVNGCKAVDGLVVATPVRPKVSLQSRIDALAASGGGVLRLTAGIYRTGALFFKPGVGLHLERGAVLMGSDDERDYPRQLTRIEGETCEYYPALVNADRCDGFAISGEGVIDGHGLPTWKAFWKMVADHEKRGEAWVNKAPGILRPRLLYVSDSRDVDISGVTFKNSKFWTTHYHRCENLRIHDCRIVSETIGGVRGPSTDAIDLDVVNGAVISNVVMDVNDDAVVLKGGKGPWADDFSAFPGNGPTRGITIVDCLFKSACHHCLTFGSECVRGSDVRMRNCRVEGAGTLLRFKLRPDTPQLYENVEISGVRGHVGTVLLISPWTQFFDLKGRTDKPPSCVRNVALNDIDVRCEKEFDVRESKDYRLDNFTRDGRQIIWENRKQDVTFGRRMSGARSEPNNQNK